MKRKQAIVAAIATLLSLAALGAAGPAAVAAATDDKPGLKAEDAFDIEYATDPRISADGSRVVYVRHWADIAGDARYSNLWIIDVETGRQRALTSGKFHESTPRWSPDGDRLAFISDRGGSAQIHVMWMESGHSAPITNLTRAPAGLAWSPDGTRLAFTALVPGTAPSIATMPSPPEGATWAEPALVVDRLVYRFNGAGYLDEGFWHVFVVPADGGTARQISSGDFHHGGITWVGGGPVWTPDGKSILVSANRRKDWDMEWLDSEVWAFAVEDGGVRKLTDRRGPDAGVAVSPDGKRIAYVGYDDRYQGYQLNRLYVQDLRDPDAKPVAKNDGGGARVLAEDLDRQAQNPQWAPDGKGVYFTYADHGRIKLALAGLDGSLKTVAEELGAGLSAYAGGASFTVADNGTVAFSHETWDRPGDVAVVRRGAKQPSVLTSLNDDLFAQRTLAAIDTFTVGSVKDDRPIEAWVLKPPGFDPQEKYPLILEIHGGPFAAYGPLFDLEKQVWAARGYVIVYANPRGSSSYGREFGNLIHHAYPGDDFFDLDSVVTHMVSAGYVDASRLYVTGGSGGGVLTCWMIGRTDRFRAAVTVYPVINWFSWVLTSDIPSFGVKYWFPGMPWEHTEHYMQRSLFSVFGNVTTPTMVITGEADWRTPISESEQYYTALKLKGVETALVRVPGEPHGIRVRPSHHVAKMLNIVGWFDRYE